jgi:hypothetical protein
VLCFAGEADGKYSGQFAAWPQTGEFYATLVRWTAGKRQRLPDDQLLTEQVRDGVCFVQLHLDPGRKADPFATLPRVKTLRGLPGTPPGKLTLPLQWKNADLLEAAIPITGRETLLNTVEISGQQPVLLPPVCLPYSPEFAPDQPGRGSATLTRIAATSGGKERVELPQTWADLQVKPRYIELTPWLLVLAVILFLLEVFERRTGWVSRLLGARAPVQAAVEELPDATPLPAQGPSLWQQFMRRFAGRPAARKPAPRRETAKPVSPRAAPSSATEPAASTDPNLDALRQARERAGRRTRRDV